MTLRTTALLLLNAAVCRPQAPPVIRSETRLVVVDVVVTDKKGAYVHDLAAKDFHLLDDNKEQTIQSFSLESSAANQTPQPDYTLVVFDYAGMTSPEQGRARLAAMRFIDANTGPTRRMAIANIDYGLRIVQGFTDSPGHLKDALAASKATVAAPISAAAGASAAADLGSRDRLLALVSLASDLSAAPGRKTIVLFTGNLAASSAQKEVLAKAIDTCNRSNVAVYPVDVRDISMPSTLRAENGAGPRGAVGAPPARGGGRAPVGRGGRGNIDPDLAADPNGITQQVLYALATGTGGFVVRNAAELPSGLQKVGEEQGEYYALGFTPAESKEESCHTLKLKTDRAGLTLRARSGYCTSPAATLVTGNAADDNLAKRAASGQAGGISASLRVPFFYEGAGVARVYVLMEIQPESIKFEKKQNMLHADLNILGVASTAGGDTGARFNDTLTLDFDEADQSWRQKPIHYRKEFKIAPGEYTFTVALGTNAPGANSDASFGKLTQPLAIPPYQPGQLSLSALALGTEISRDPSAEASSLFDDHTPLVVNGIEFIPTGAEFFTKSGQAFCYFVIYPGPAGAAHTLRMRIVDAKTGQAAWDGGDAKIELPAGKPSVSVGVNVPIAMQAPGAYRFEVTLTDKAGTAVQRTAPFEVK